MILVEGLNSNGELDEFWAMTQAEIEERAQLNIENTATALRAKVQFHELMNTPLYPNGVRPL